MAEAIEPKSGTKEDVKLDLSQLLIATASAMLLGALYIALSDFLRLGPPWLVLVIEVILLAPPLVWALLLRRTLPFMVARGLTLALLVLVAGSLIASLVLLVQHLLRFTSTMELLQQAGAALGYQPADLCLMVLGDRRRWATETAVDGPSGSGLPVPTADWGQPVEMGGGVR